MNHLSSYLCQEDTYTHIYTHTHVYVFSYINEAIEAKKKLRNIYNAWKGSRILTKVNQPDFKNPALPTIPVVLP